MVDEDYAEMINMLITSNSEERRICWRRESEGDEMMVMAALCSVILSLAALYSYFS